MPTKVADELDIDPASFYPPWEESENIVGTPETDSRFWQPQTTQFTCAVMAQRGIIEAFTGENVSEAQRVYDATILGWLIEGRRGDPVGR